MTKEELRRLVRSQKRMYSAPQLQAMSAEAVARLMALPQMAAAKTVMLYYSLADEVSTHELADRLVERGKMVVLPVVTGPAEMKLRRYRSADDLSMGAFGIMEPTGEPFTSLAEIDLAVVPGMAFDTRGNRLGRGKGYYDRFLSQLPQATKVGLCFPFQKFPGVPTDENDVRMDLVI